MLDVMTPTIERTDNVYHELYNLGDDDGQDKAPVVDYRSQGWNSPDAPKMEAALKTPIKSVANISKLTKSYDWSTKNKSFLELYKDLYTLGIKNNKFFLAIYDRSLIGVDPFSAALPLQIQLRIAMECRRNPWYFLREVCRIPVEGKAIEIGGGSEFLIDRTSAASWYLFINGISNYACKPRQTGKTQCALSEMNYAYLFSAISSAILFANKDSENNKMNLYRMKCQRDMLPAYLQMRVAYDEDGGLVKEKNSITTIRNPVNGNSVKLMPRPNSVGSAMTCGRGATSPLMYYDEFDFFPFNNIVLQSAIFAYSTASKNAKANNSAYGIIMTSTPGDLDSRDGESATKWLEHTLRWKDEMYDTPIEELRAQASDSKSKRNGFINIQHTWQQLKKDQAWYENQCKNVSYDMETILREIDLQRLHGSSLSPFSRESIMYIQTHQKTPIKEIDFSKNLCPFKFYTKLKKSVPYFICVDPSEGLANDNNAITVESPATLKPVAEFRSPYISPEGMQIMIENFMDLFCPNALIIVENNRGRELLNRLKAGRYAQRVWYDDGKMLDIAEKVKKFGPQSREAYERRTLGLNTNPTTRNIMMGILERMMDEERYKLYTEYLVNDISGLIRTPTGRLEAGKGSHDDNIMSYLFGPYIYYNANNLESFGIYKGMYDEFEDGDDDSMRFKIKQAVDNPKSEEDEELDNIKKMIDMYPNLPTEMQAMVHDQLFAPDVQQKLKRKKKLNLGNIIKTSIRDEAADLLKEDTATDFMNNRYNNRSSRSFSSMENFINQTEPGYTGGSSQILDADQREDFNHSLLEMNDLQYQQPAFDINDYI